MTADETQNDDLITQVVAAFGQMSIPPRPSTLETLDLIHIDEISEGTMGDIPTPRTKLLRIAAPLAMAAAIGFVLLSVWPSGKGDAFAQVIEQLISVSAVSFKITMKRPDNPEMSGQAYALSPNLLRIDWNGTDQKTISITDYAKGEFVAIESKAKSARVFKTSESSGYDIVKRLREAQAGSGRSVTPKGEADRDTEVFEIREGDAISTIWVNVKAKLPIRCELRVPDKPALGSVVYSYFDWNPVIAESKFAIPEGFTRVEDDLLAEPTEEQFVAALRIRQAFTDEPYPADFPSDSPGLLIGRSAYDSGRSPDQNHARQLTQLQSMLNDLGLTIPQAQDRKLLQQRIDFLCRKADQFQTVILSTGRWVGGGVTPGDPDKPLCWWRPRKSDRVRVLYGDLTIREAPEPPAAK